MSSSPSHLSDSNVRRYGNVTRGAKKSLVMYSDYYGDEKDKGGDGGGNPVLSVAQRSVSLTALHPGPAPLEPRMAQLETLEAKMASIEVSLSSTTTTPRRKKASLGGQPLQRASRDTARELETLRNALRDKENVIQSLKGQLSNSPGVGRLAGAFLRSSRTAPLGEEERRAARDRLNRLRQDMDNKRLAIKNLALALERLDVSDNIDVRIQQAELEFQLGREELNLLSLLEEARGLQTLLEEADSAKAKGDSTSLFSCVSGAGHVTLHAVALDYDAKSPRFGAGPRDSAQGLFVDWAAADCGMVKGDRLVEVNGKLVLATKTREDLLRLLAVSPSPAQMLVLRTKSECEWLGVKVRAEDAERDNVRLSHRISYLEEQVAELLQQQGGKTPEVTAEVDTAPDGQLQVFQKGPQVTALVANLPGMASPKNSLPTVRPKSRNADVRSTKSLDVCGSSDSRHRHHLHHHHHLKHQQLQSAHSTNSLDVCAVDVASSTHLLQPRSRHHISEVRRSQNGHSLLELTLDRPQKPHRAKLADRHKADEKPRPSRGEAESAGKSLDYSSEPSAQGRPHQRPTPPKKPLRLSLHRATSLQTVAVAPPPPLSSEDQSRKAAAKRNHKGEATPSRGESCQSALRWPSSLRTSRGRASLVTGSSPGEKWY